MDISIIYVEDDKSVQFAYQQSMKMAGFAVQAVDTAEAGLELVKKNRESIVVSDIRLPGMSGIELMHQVLKLDEDMPIVLVTGHGDVEMAVKAIKLGAYDFIEKPCNSERLTEVLKRAIEKRRLVLENQQLRLAQKTRKGPTMIGQSKVMQQIRETLLNISDTDADVLIQGETGTGKEVVANCIHMWSSRRDRHFVPLNCASFPDTLFESEMFGHEAGAFTGASKKRIGKIEHANQGTLFLDEIESMPLDIQAKFLRVLQERSVERLGDNKIIPVDCRVVAATKENLLDLSQRKEFRLDLFYRLNVVTIDLPPLRNRREDIPELFYFFASEAAQHYHRPVPDIQPELLIWLQTQDWPGNVRELKHTADRYVLGLFAPDIEGGAVSDDHRMGLSASLDAFEKRMIEGALQQHGGHVGSAAKQLLLPRKTLYDKLNRHGIQPETFRETD
ncbi:sigma-54-dependent Fis family transcriptional regulator [Cohaesibacter sp. CAU 1516]|uniref:sigma-54-dependent transcriptional regulator n=1 Tax=Cohaesibacter sp. CAU 1516 TaxID=2576038 RepID=UPI0010FEDA92|nr:sigma-54 dependent transcriptional regulator [Cohaesibacter sp. CAU 1516]TLP47014.1 sigma-54-dependent Fis family transcriptional regulator [Cohaesibacter sp. CAU 1516]